MFQIVKEHCDAKEMKIEYDETKSNGQMRKDIEISKMQKYFQGFQVTKLEDGIREIYKKRIKVK